MNRIVARAADKLLGAFAPKISAGACCPPDGYYTCYNHAKLYCKYNCSCQVYCSQVGSC